MDSLATLKIGLLVLAHICYHVSVTPPNKAPPPQETSRYSSDALASYIKYTANVITETIVYSTTLGQAATAYNSAHPSSPYAARIASSILHSPPPAGSAVTALHPMFIAGMVSLFVGTIIRVSCYHTLGQLFTFELSIREKHKLVTHGPYSIVRHPSYVGSFFAKTGMALCTFGPGSWLWEAGWMRTIQGQCLMVIVCGSSAAVLFEMVRRTAVEDKVLKKEFGVQWDRWAMRVPCRLVPGVY